MTRSRLYRHIDGERKKQTIFSLIGIVVVIGLLLKFAPVIVDGIGSLVLSVNEKNDVQTNNNTQTAIINPPDLKSDFTATFSARITIAGTTTQDKGEVELFVNGSSVDSQKVHGKDFTFENVKLSDGQNIIKARQIIDNNKSDFSDDLDILKTGEEVKIDELSPSDGQEFKKGDDRIQVSGKTDSLNDITVNGSRTVVDQDGKFNYTLQLHDGDNEVKVTATSPSGKSTGQTIHVKYNP